MTATIDHSAGFFFIVPNAVVHQDVQLPVSDDALYAQAKQFYLKFANIEYVNSFADNVRKFIWFVLAHLVGDQLETDEVYKALPEEKQSFFGLVLYAAFTMGIAYGKLVGNK